MLAPIIVLILRILLVFVLYSFLGWTIYTLWKDLKIKSMAVQIQKVPTITLIERSDVTENKENSYSVPEVTFGRDPGNTICLDDETVSNQHAVLNYRNGH